MTPPTRQKRLDIRARLRKLGLPEKIRLRLDLPSSAVKLRRVFPFRRSWIGIGILAAFDAVFMIPAITAAGQAMEHWAKVDTLFDLTTAVFLSAWLLGWSVAPLLMTTILLLMLTGREVVKASKGVLEIGIGLPGLLVSAQFDAAKVANLRITHPQPKSGTSWRGSHLSFDYNGHQIDFGSDIKQRDVPSLSRQIQAATGTPFGASHDAAGERTEETFVSEVALELEPLAAAGRAPAAAARQVSLASASTMALIVANVLPIIGAVFFDWRLSDVMVLYWAESAVIGFYNLLKLIAIAKWFALVMGPFFVGHFGGFMAVHFMFLYSLFVQGPDAKGGGDLQQVAAMFMDLWPALAALFISHGVSFFTNFVVKKEYGRLDAKRQMAAPYSRIIFMHIVLIFGGFVVMLLGDPLPVLLGVIVLKIVFDVKAHLKEHRNDPDSARVML